MNINNPIVGKHVKVNKGSRNILWLLLKEMRPKQWTKNLLLFAALLFSLNKVSYEMILRSFVGFFLFCLVSGCVYVLNDFIDHEADRMHPEKRYRPMASGALNPYVGLVVGFLLLIASFVSGFLLDTYFGIILAVYFIINVAYSLRMKHVVIIDVMIIAAGFVLRAIGGGVVIEVSFTPWFLLCIMLLALFLAISKRRQELLLLEENKSSHRKVLEQYSVSLLDQLNTIVVTGTIISYSLFTFTAGHSVYLMLTIPLVIYGIFRYLYLIHVKNKGGAPEKVLLEDKPILITCLLYVILTVIIMTNFKG